MAGEASNGARPLDMINEMAQRVRLNHCLLNGSGVGHKSLDEVFATSARHGLACKLTGAGGGGCAITLLNDQKRNWVEDREALRKDIEALGYDTFLSSIGGDEFSGTGKSECERERERAGSCRTICRIEVHLYPLVITAVLQIYKLFDDRC